MINHMGATPAGAWPKGTGTLGSLLANLVDGLVDAGDGETTIIVIGTTPDHRRRAFAKSLAVIANAFRIPGPNEPEEDLEDCALRIIDAFAKKLIDAHDVIDGIKTIINPNNGDNHDE